MWYLNVFKKSFVFFFSLVLIISCTTDDNANNEGENNTLCGESMEGYTGTICCVLGSDTGIPGNQLTYEYESNRTHTEIEWEVVSGDMTIVSGQGTTSVVVELGANFEGGELSGLGNGELKCSAIVNIEKE